MPSLHLPFFCFHVLQHRGALDHEEGPLKDGIEKAKVVAVQAAEKVDEVTAVAADKTKAVASATAEKTQEVRALLDIP